MRGAAFSIALASTLLGGAPCSAATVVLNLTVDTVAEHWCVHSGPGAISQYSAGDCLSVGRDGAGNESKPGYYWRLTRVTAHDASHSYVMYIDPRWSEACPPEWCTLPHPPATSSSTPWHVVLPDFNYLYFEAFDAARRDHFTIQVTVAGEFLSSGDFPKILSASTIREIKIGSFDKKVRIFHLAGSTSEAFDWGDPKTPDFLK